MMKPGHGIKISAVAALLIAALTGCNGNSGLAGEYGQQESGVWFPILDFKRSGGVTLKTSGSADDEAGTWERNGNQVVVKVAGDTRTLTVDGNGCLDGGTNNNFFSGVICKKP